LNAAATYAEATSAESRNGVTHSRSVVTIAFMLRIDPAQFGFVKLRGAFA
jgi:hypothetical protein